MKPATHLPVGDALAQKVLSLPMHPYLAKGGISRMTGAIANVGNVGI